MRINGARGALSVGIMTALLAGTPASGALAAARSGDGDAGPLVKGHGITQSDEKDKADGVVITLHGVRRVPHGTVVYASGIGKTDGGNSTYFGENGAAPKNGPMSAPCHTTIIDTKGGKLYDPLPHPDFGSLGCAAYPWSEPSPKTPDPGAVIAVVLPEIPAELTEVDLMVGGVEFQKVPVEDGLLTPMADSEFVTLASGQWPKVDQADIDKAAGKAGDGSVRSLEFVVEDLKGEQGTTVGGATTTVRVKSDILFAVDKYELTESAKKRIAEIADELKRTADLSKPVLVTGHTDNVNTQAYNQTLSEKRAKSVADELKKHLPAGTEIKEAGKSFTEPIADNGTDAGKAKNRRVEIEVSNK